MMDHHVKVHHVRDHMSDHMKVDHVRYHMNVYLMSDHMKVNHVRDHVRDHIKTLQIRDYMKTHHMRDHMRAHHMRDHMKTHHMRVTGQSEEANMTPLLSPEIGQLCAVIGSQMVVARIGGVRGSSVGLYGRVAVKCSGAVWYVVLMYSMGWYDMVWNYII